MPLAAPDTRALLVRRAGVPFGRRAHQHLVSELHPVGRAEIYSAPPGRTWLRIGQSHGLFTVPGVISTRHADVSAGVWYPWALRRFPQFDGVAARRECVLVNAATECACEYALPSPRFLLACEVSVKKKAHPSQGWARKKLHGTLSSHTMREKLNGSLLRGGYRRAKSHTHTTRLALFHTQTEKTESFLFLSD